MRNIAPIALAFFSLNILLVSAPQRMRAHEMSTQEMRTHVLRTPTPSPPSPPGAVLPQVPFASLPTPEPVFPPDDARSPVCIAQQMPGFQPFTVRPGDTLDLLLLGDTAFTPAQVASLNCLDSQDLPAGAVIGLPGDSAAFAPVGTPLEPGTPTADETLLRVLPESADLLNTETLTLTWSAPPGSISLYPCASEAACVRPSTLLSAQPGAGVAIDGFQSAGSFGFQVEWQSPSGETATRYLPLTITCAYTWLATQATHRCPDAPPQALFAVYQPFQHGLMIYRSDTGHLLVLYQTGASETYTDVYVEGMPAPAAVAPDGLFTPTRGFGALWAWLGGADSTLGWATATERGYDLQLQPAGRSSFTTYLSLPPTGGGIRPSGVIALTTVTGQAQGYWALAQQ